MGGFQPVGIIEPKSRGARIGTPGKDFIQIVNTGQHWVCVATSGQEMGTLAIYDSLGVGRSLGESKTEASEPKLVESETILNKCVYFGIVSMIPF